MTDIIKCLKCNHVLISGNGATLFFGKGTSLACLKCGNTYVFGETPKKIIMRIIMTEYGIAILAAIAYLDTADSTERIYFLDTLNTNYCSMCGEKMSPNEPCECYLAVWHDNKDEE